jgi:hypothetical protein
MPLIEMEELEKYDCIDAHLIALHLIVCFFLLLVAVLCMLFD